jgi:hypothetical protein
VSNWNCFICGAEITGLHKVIYCEPTHYTRGQLAKMKGPPKVVDRLLGPAKWVDIKVEKGRPGAGFGVAFLDRWIGVSPESPRYTRWHEVEPPKERHWYDNIFGASNIYKCHLHVACYEKCKHPDDKRPLAENMSYGF